MPINTHLEPRSSFAAPGDVETLSELSEAPTENVSRCAGIVSELGTKTRRKMGGFPEMGVPQ